MMILQRFITKLGLFFILTLLIPGNYSCHNDNHDVVPYIPVNLILDIQTDLGHLGVGECATIVPDEQGFGTISFTHPSYPEIRLGQQVYGNGLILYRMAQYEFAVYDKTCTYRASTDYCALEMDETGLIPRCPCCGSEFAIPIDGAIASGPAVLPLKAYSAYINSYQLYISN